MWEDVWMPAEQDYIDKQNPECAADLVLSGTNGDYVNNL
jgi:hypothetical protein